jgi:hypothetical protein
VHDHGLVALVDAMPRFAPAGKTADFAIVQAARVSYGEGTKQVNEDRGLIRYLARHRHTTPFEMVEFKFHHVMPIFIARPVDSSSHRQCERVQRAILGRSRPVLPAECRRGSEAVGE